MLLIVHLTNQMFVQMFKVCIQMQMHLQLHGGIWMRIQMLNIQMHLHLLTSLVQWWQVFNRYRFRRDEIIDLVDLAGYNVWFLHKTARSQQCCKVLSPCPYLHVQYSNCQVVVGNLFGISN